MKNISIILLVFLASFQSFSQTIKGKVADDKGMPIPGANVTNTNGLSSASSDFDGNFIINAKAGDKLKISMIGYTAVTVAASQDMTVKLKEETTELKEVVAIGYGTRRAIDATMSVAKIKSDVISKQKVLNPLQSVQGNLTGVTVVSSDAPGSQPSFIIRGANSLVDRENKPLFVVDGIRQNNINNLNSSNIESIEVLKDASALAIYGNEASNGVVIITTKKTKGDLVVSVDSYVGLRTPLKIVEMAPSNLYAQYTNLANKTVLLSQDQPVNTNWIDEVVRMGQYSNIDLNLSGSSEKHTYSFNVNNYEETSIVGAKYSRVTARLYNDFKITDKLKLTASLNSGFTNQTAKDAGKITDAYKMPSIVPVYNSDGSYGQPFVGANGYVDQNGTLPIVNFRNPIAGLDFEDKKLRNLNLIAGISLEYKLSKRLKFNSNFGGEVNEFKEYIFDDYEGRDIANGTPHTGDIYNSINRKRDNSFKWNFNNLLTYNLKLGNSHDFELMAGVEMISDRGGEYLEGIAKNVRPQENYWSIDLAQTSVQNEAKGKYKDERRKYSYLGRFNYKLLDRYLLTANIRRDGSSQFAPGYQWGVFPSFGAGWVISKEGFLKESNLINLLKLRGGWGLLGNENIGPNVQSNSVGTSGYSFGGVPVAFVSNTQEISKELSWEETREFSVGIDYAILQNKLKGSFDFYDKLNRNAIFFIRSQTTDGAPKDIPIHGAKISNKGFELEISWNDKISENLSYRVGGNYSKNENKLFEVLNNRFNIVSGGLNNGIDTKLTSEESVGQPIGSYYLYEYAGLDGNGQMLYYTASGNKVLQSDLKTSDKKFMGSAMPTSTYGINFGVTYKSFDLSVVGYGTFGAKIYNGKKAQRFGNENIELSVAEDFWTPTNTDASNPAPFNTIPVASDFYLESGDFFRINNINLTYNLKSFAKFITGGQIYINAINPFISQKYTGFSPEIAGNPTEMMGVELYAYPTLRTFTFGTKLNF